MVVGIPAAVGSVADLLTTIINKSSEWGITRKKKQYLSLLREIRELEEKSDEETDDNLLHHKRHEFDLFLSVWETEIKSGGLAKP